jgi:hypothetical protein
VPVHRLPCSDVLGAGARPEPRLNLGRSKRNAPYPLGWCAGGPCQEVGDATVLSGP